MITVFLPEIPGIVKQVSAALDHEALYNPAFAGAEFVIGFDFYPWIDGADEIAGTYLLHSIINPIIETLGE